MFIFFLTESQKKVNKILMIKRQDLTMLIEDMNVREFDSALSPLPIKARQNVSKHHQQDKTKGR